MVVVYEEFIKLLKQDFKSRGVRFTDKQQKVMRVLYRNQDRYINCQEIYQILKSNNEEIAIATVYRNLAWFKSLGLVRGISSRDSQMIYQLKDQSNHQFICTKCGYVKNLNIGDLHSHPEIYVEDIQIFGLCTSCKTTEV